MKRFLSLFHPYGFYICYCNMDSTQLCISIAMVIGPTPPGTGVIADVCGATSSYLIIPAQLVVLIAVNSHIDDNRPFL